MKTTCGIYLYSTALKKLLVCHATNASWKTWSIPKGLKDPGEESFIAATRELKEETGIDLRKISVLNVRELPAVKYKKQNKTLEAFLVITDDLFIFMFENALFDCEDWTVGGDMRPTFAPVAHEQALLRHHDRGPRLSHFNREIVLEFRRAHIIAHHVSQPFVPL